MRHYILSILVLLIVSCESQRSLYNKDDCVILSEGKNDICDFYCLDIDYNDIVASDVYGCTRYVDCLGATSVELKIPLLLENANVGVVFYDKNKKVLSSFSFRDCQSNTISSFPVPPGAAFFRTSYYNSEYKKYYDSFGYKLNNDVLSEFRPYHEEPVFFSLPIEQDLSFYTGNQKSNSELKETTSVLLLPKAYDPKGEPVPIIMYCHGYSHYVYYDHWGSTDSFVLQKQHWADMGYAVFDTNGARNNRKKGAFVSAGAPQFVEAMRASFEYIHEHYNVQDSIYVIGGSAGGLLALNYARFNNNVKCVALLSAWTDLYNCVWSQGCRSAFTEFYGFNNERIYEDRRVAYYDPSKNLESINVPIKLWISDLEKGTVIYSTSMSYMKQLQGLGKSAEIALVHGLSHSQLVSGAEMEVDKGIVDWFESIE